MLSDSMVLRFYHSTMRRCRRFWHAALLLLAALTFLLVHLLVDEEASRLKVHVHRKTINVYTWADNPTVGCSGNFLGYAQEYARLQYARLNSKTRTFSIPCADSEIPEYKFQYGYEGTPLQLWHGNMTTYPIPLIQSLSIRTTKTIVVNRFEAHNLYHTMCEWYNVFLLSKLLDFKPSEVDILFLDDRPHSPLDETWETLFKTVHKYSSIEYNAAFKDLIWNIIGYESPMNFHYVTKLPFTREFHDFMLSSYNIPDIKTLNCDKLTVTLFLRRDYMTHPERKTISGGLVHRKFKNEDEIIAEIKNVFQGAVLNIVILEKISMKEQLEIVVNTDILIGMHGAGMSHVLFLPRHAAVFEMFPNYWGYLTHFKAMARWHHVKYFGWQNKDKANEFPGFYTRIPMDVLRKQCNEMRAYVCGAFLIQPW